MKFQVAAAAAAQLFICSAVLCCLAAVPSVSSEKSTVSAPSLHGTTPDPFVQMAPLVVAMSCRDGIAIVAAHTSFESDDPLLFYNAEEEEEEEEKEASTAIKKKDDEHDDEKPPFLDLPFTYSGPLRIQSVGSAGTALVACGWRADGSGRLLYKAREFADAERQTFGEESSSILPSQLALYMAECAVSERRRALSCASLVAYGDTSNRRGAVTAGASVPGYLWLVDVTGAYPLRAHCMGGGLTKTSAKTKAGVDEASSDIVPVADVVNRKLLELLRTERLSGTKRLSYFDVTAEEGLKKMLGLLSSSGLEGGESSLHGPLLQHGTRLELATVDAAQQRIVRKRVSDIWGSGKRGQQIPSPY